MIPAILAAPLVQGVVGSVVGGVMNAFAPSAPSAPPPPFSPYMDRVARPTTSAPNAPSGMMHSQQLQQMTPAQAQAWANGITGRQADATDSSGRTISGVVSGVHQLGHTLALTIGGHLVSLSQLQQISWSPSTV